MDGPKIFDVERRLSREWSGHYTVVYLAMIAAAAHIIEALFWDPLKPSFFHLFVGAFELMLVVFATITAESAKQADVMEEAIVEFETMSKHEASPGL